METAEKQVTDVVKVDIHLDYTPDGKRYIDRISEIVQLEEGVPYPEYDLNDPDNSMNKITAEYYRRKTDRVGFTTRLILKYNLDTHTYEVRDRFSPYLENRLRGNLGAELQVGFDEFMLREWGPRKDDENGVIIICSSCADGTGGGRLRVEGLCLPVLQNSALQQVLDEHPGGGCDGQTASFRRQCLG